MEIEKRAAVCDSSSVTPAASPKSRDTRWHEETGFFDALAERAVDVGPVDPLELARYGSSPLRGWFNKEFQFKVLGDLVGKRVLDVGCGDGENAMLLARLGAHVTGVDISSKSIEVAGKRAVANGVAETTRFVCSPLETAELESGSFDIVMCQGILHHVIDELEPIMAKVASWCRPGGLILVSEPTNLAPWLRWLRLRLPIPMYATPGERPLEKAEVDIISRYIAAPRMRRFLLLARIQRKLLGDRPFQKLPLALRIIVSGIAAMDAVLLGIPALAPLGAVTVFYGAPRPSK